MVRCSQAASPPWLSSSTRSRSATWPRYNKARQSGRKNVRHNEKAILNANTNTESRAMRRSTAKRRNKTTSTQQDRKRAKKERHRGRASQHGRTSIPNQHNKRAIGCPRPRGFAPHPRGLRRLRLQHQRLSATWSRQMVNFEKSKASRAGKLGQMDA